MESTTLIKIEGSPNKVEYGKVKGQIVKIGAKYYFKDSKHVVFVPYVKKYFRVKSKLITRDINGNVILASDSVVINERIYFKYDQSITNDIFGQPRLVSETLQIRITGREIDENGVKIKAIPCDQSGESRSLSSGSQTFRVHNSYKNIGLDTLTGQVYHTSCLVKLGYKSYKSNKTDSFKAAAIAKGFSFAEGIFCHADAGSLRKCSIDGLWYFSSDMIEILDHTFKRMLIFKDNKKILSGKTVDVFPYDSTQLSGHINPFEIRTDSVFISSDCGFHWRDLFEYSDIMSCFVKKGHKEKLEEYYNTFILRNKKSASYRSAITELESYISNKITPESMLGSSQYPEQKHFIQIRRERVSGGQTFYSPKIMSHDKSSTSKGVGGKNYTFGIEYETAAGDVPQYLLDSAKIKKTGDGSLHDRDYPLSCYEYVSGVLHGDRGLSLMKKQLEAISRFTYFSHLCSTHIHIGGANNTEKPIFNRRFSALAIKLGSMIEDDLFDMVPRFRDPRVNDWAARYCSSIKKKYGKIDLKDPADWKKKLFDFVFDNDVPEAKTFSKIANSSSKLQRFHIHGRYKWLNLVNCNTDNSNLNPNNNGFKTIEFRLFPPTISYEELRMYVAICMSFVWFIENKQSVIINSKKISLTDVVSSAFEGRSTLNEVLSFISMKTELRKKYDASLSKENKQRLVTPDDILDIIGERNF